ncbi:hypothetical protein [Psychroflexus sp. ALD_RP9]|uniref:hypothetical protein n=1 Tax=Psychroflexus sp. ALD_RP9 TaxID=2777186 RepID=UPI001A8CE031|nr:hypothetical protein [Psychroflexus sp. ALD_RP9]QSS98110.1 hypothetical protein IMZ30_05185 [Psychroflexus sp. ALD_RP9]
MKTIKNFALLGLFVIGLTACTENSFSDTQELNDLSSEQNDGFTGDETEIPDGSKGSHD